MHACKNKFRFLTCMTCASLFSSTRVQFHCDPSFSTPSAYIYMHMQHHIKKKYDASTPEKSLRTIEQRPRGEEISTCRDLLNATHACICCIAVRLTSVMGGNLSSVVGRTKDSSIGTTRHGESATFHRLLSIYGF